MPLDSPDLPINASSSRNLLTFEYVHTLSVTKSTNIPTGLNLTNYGQRMAGCIKPHDIVGAHEIAMRLHVGRPQVVHEWRRRYDDFPEPIATLKTALIWDWKQVHAWAQKTGRTST